VITCTGTHRGGAVGVFRTSHMKKLTLSFSEVSIYVSENRRLRCKITQWELL
jgi:hypothetical protein